MSAGPLAGLRVIELTGQGPGPYGASLLADFGCDVVCIDRAAADPAVAAEPSSNPLMRGKRSIVVDLKQDGAAGRVVELVGAADVFIDPFRPGVCERLGLGPEVLCAINPRLIYVRITGYGQDGPLPPVTTSTTWRCPGRWRCSATSPVVRRCSRSTSSATSLAGR